MLDTLNASCQTSCTHTLTHTLRGAASRLGWDTRTLVKWMGRAGIEPTIPPVDSKRKLLTEDQLDAIATFRTARVGDTPPGLRIAELEAEVARLRALVLAEARDLPVRAPVVTRPLPQPAPHETLPGGWLSMERLAMLHGKRRSTVQYRVDKGHIALAPGGPWKSGGATVVRAVDDEGQRQFHAIYLDAPYNAACPYCRAHGSPRYD